MHPGWRRPHPLSALSAHPARHSDAHPSLLCLRQPPGGAVCRRRFARPLAGRPAFAYPSGSPDGFPVVERPYYWKTAAGLSVIVTGYAASPITLPVELSFNAWFQSTASAALGRQFTATIPLTLTGDVLTPHLVGGGGLRFRHVGEPPGRLPASPGPVWPGFCHSPDRRPRWYSSSHAAPTKTEITASVNQKTPASIIRIARLCPGN